MQEICLNFVELQVQSTQFTIHAKLAPPTLPKDESDYRAKLPILDSIDPDDEWQLHDISFSPKADYKPRTLNYTDNAHLSEQYLFIYLQSEIQKRKQQELFQINPSSKYKEITYILEKGQTGNLAVKIHPYFLRAERKLGFLLQIHFDLKKDQKLNKSSLIESLSLDKTGRPNVFINRDRFSKLQYFSNIFAELLHDSVISIRNDFTPMSAKELNKKTYLVGGNKHSDSQFLGVRKYAPYKLLADDAKFIFLFTERTRSLARDIYLGLTGKLFPGQFSGMNDMFKLSFNKENVTHVVIDRFDQENLDKFESQLKETKKNTAAGKVMIIAVPPKGIREDGSEAYSYLKFLALKNDSYCQVVTEETFHKKDELKWSVSNIGLQIFSKLGGIPWLVKPEKSDCLILGIGSVHEKKDGSTVKYSAYTVCLDSSGEFKYIEPLSNIYRL